jgi:23S rRNA pseudouridine1911/1915/1917 synthase
VSDSPLTILYESGPCLAVLKPSGIATQAPTGIDSVEARLKRFLAERDQKTGNLYLGVPHRLDRPVSGVLVFARHSRAAKRLARQFEHRTIKKLYWACVQGTVQPEPGTWRDFVLKIPNVPQAQVVAEDHPEGRDAVLHYRTLGQTTHGSWLEIELETGRYHQIRVQAATRGHIVLGDEMYGSRIPFGEQHEDRRLRAISLHARQLSFLHPMTKEPVTVVAPPPEAWQALLPRGERGAAAP